MLATFAQCGMTVRECRDLIGEILHKNLQSKEEAGGQEWLDLPLAVYLEQTRAGRMADEEAKAVEKTARVLMQVRGRITDAEAELD
jgi:hypothetical protein